ncbi:AAEL011906-PA [Aedes aegypti]|uniref:H15 domain-containing protein n=2 Tax=Aedes aegypti TaxID=7159 RepID=Q16NP2_AEDAE|nr:histone H1 [Aedes aegypti]XP_021712926.1 histone H1-like [Aedes aegypti]EAT35970.1 AAEL011906-PA [Aedes aegypti]
MADVALHPAHVAHGTSPKKAKAASKGEKKAKKPSTHPPVNDMVVAALNALKERHGTSLQAVKKYIGANYKCDLTKLSPFIKKALKSGVAKGALVQTKGTGASGSFKLKVKPKAASGEKAKKKATGGEKKKAAKKPGKKLTAGVAKPKKAKTSPARAGGAKKKATGAGLKQKSTKHSKSVAKKPKAPKPKKASGASKKSAKK